MNTTGPLAATSFRPTPEDRAAIALLRQELGGRISLNALLSMGLRELLRKHRLKLPQNKPHPKSKR